MVGLGRMGGNTARRLVRGGPEVVAYATDAAAVRRIAGEGATAARTLDDLVAALGRPRIAWVMVPAGPPTEQVVADLAARMDPGDAVVDGGNSALSDRTGTVQDSGEGRWTVLGAVEAGVPADVPSASLHVRFRSRREHTFAEKLLSAMRHKFGGHVERPSGG
jgi:6-phosphogluconate dehydrogenase (decarboxylating)